LQKRQKRGIDPKKLKKDRPAGPKKVRHQKWGKGYYSRAGRGGVVKVNAKGTAG